MRGLRLHLGPLRVEFAESLLATARRFDVTPRSIHRWIADDSIPVISAERVAHRIGLHPVEIWGDDYYTPIPPPATPGRNNIIMTAETTATIVDQIRARVDELDAEIVRLTGERDVYQEALDALAPLTDETPKTADPKPAPPPGAKVHDCPQCDRTFSTKQGVSMHITRTHKRKKKPPPPAPDSLSRLDCKACGAPFASTRRVIEHIESEHPDRTAELLHDCDVCDATYVTADTLAEHRATRHADIPNPADGCPHCPPDRQEPMTADELARHLRVFHADTFAAS